MTDQIKETETLVSGFEPKMCDRFLVNHPHIAPYLIKSIKVENLASFKVITIQVYSPCGSNMHELLDQNDCDEIKVSMLDSLGIVRDQLIFKDCKFDSSSFEADWTINKPMPIIITYTVNDDAKEVISG